MSQNRKHKPLFLRASMSDSNKSASIDEALEVGEQLDLFADYLTGSPWERPEESAAISCDDRFASAPYWSSVENNNNNAWNLDFSSGAWNNNNKNNNYRARCARSHSVCTNPKVNFLTSPDLVTLEELFQAYFSARKRKRNKVDQLSFEINLEANLIKLYGEIKDRTYKHDSYSVFVIEQPTPREVWMSSFKDRVVHHLIYARLSPKYHSVMIHDSYACIPNKGIHAAVRRSIAFSQTITNNYAQNAFYLKADVKNFFSTISHERLLDLLDKWLCSDDIRFLVNQVVRSDRSSPRLLSDERKFNLVPKHKSMLGLTEPRGLPIGNLTSQFFANVYLDEMDRFIKRELGVKRYLRYADDFLIFDTNHARLNDLWHAINLFTQKSLSLSLHPDKKTIRRVDHGYDFLGYFVLPGRIYPRSSTVKRMRKKGVFSNGDVKNYHGYFSFANSHNFIQTEVGKCS